MKFELEQYNRNTPDDELIADMRRVALELGKEAVTIDEQNERGRFHATTMIRRFGKWTIALEKAGLQQTRSRLNIPEEELFKNLEEIWIKLGRQPRYAEILKPISKYGAKTYDNRFGSWRNALKAFVAYVNTEQGPSSELAISQQAKGEIGQQGTRNINWRLRFIMMRRDNFKCRVCGRSPATDPSVTLDVDHIKAYSKGGLTILENLQTLCTKCNIGKSDLEFLDPTTEATTASAEGATT